MQNRMNDGHDQVTPQPTDTPPRRMDRVEITNVVEEALDRLIAEQSELLDFDVTERALTHYLAIYIRELVPDGYDVDVEYNRHRRNTKRLQLPPRRARDHELRATTVFPDVIVHKRNIDDHNLLVIEMKKPDEDRDYDELKLRAFRKELNYQHTAHVIVGRVDAMIVRQIIWVDDNTTE